VQHLTLDLKSFGRARVGGDRFVHQLVSLGRFTSVQQLCELQFGLRSTGIELDCLAQQCLGLGLIAQPNSRDTEGGPDLALENRIAIARLHQVYQLGVFVLAEQSVCQHRQVIGLVAIALARGARLALSRLQITFLQIHFGKTRPQNRISRRIADRIAQFDLGGLEITFCDVLFRLFDGGGRVFSVRG